MNEQTRAAAPSDAGVSYQDVNYWDPGLRQDPFPYYHALRAAAPVYRLPHKIAPTMPDTYLVTSYDLVQSVIRDPETFSNAFGRVMNAGPESDPELEAIFAKGWPTIDTLLTNDPPSHKRFRGLVNRAFTASRVNKLEDYIRQVANELLDKIAPAGACEFHSQFSVLLPLTVISDQLGVPRSDLGLFKTFSDAFVLRLSRMSGREEDLAAARKIVEFQHYFVDVINEKKRNPTDDIISDLVNARLEGERPLNDAELLSVIQQLLVAGNETTASSLTGGMLQLIRNPDQRQKVLDDPSLIPNMVEEILRLESPSAGIWRVTTRDVELNGVAIPKDTLVMVRYDAANRDPAKFPDPDRFDVARENASNNLAFGQGIHFCVGAMLSRKEMNVAMPLLLQRLKNFRLGPDNDLKVYPSVLLRGVHKLNLAYDPE